MDHKKTRSIPLAIVELIFLVAIVAMFFVLQLLGAGVLSRISHLNQYFGVVTYCSLVVFSLISAAFEILRSHPSPVILGIRTVLSSFVILLIGFCISGNKISLKTSILHLCLYMVLTLIMFFVFSLVKTRKHRHRNHKFRFSN